MAYRVTNEDGLRMRGTRVANVGDVVSEEFFNTYATDYGWKDQAERVNKADLAKSTKSDTPGSVDKVGQTAELPSSAEDGNHA